MNWLKLFSAQSNSLVLHFASLVLPSVLVAACVYVPPVWDVFDEVGYVGSIEKGVTTKEEILKKLGKPQIENKEENTFYYHGMGSAGAICAGVPGGGGCRLIGEERWWVKIFFDRNDVVSGVASSEEPGHARIVLAQQLLDRARSGDPEAQYQIGYDYLKDKNPRAIFWVCRAANQSHRLAQSMMGYFHREDLEKASGKYLAIERDNRLAFMWYSLAVANGYSPAERYRDEVASNMTSAEIARAERLVQEWKPDLASCGIETAGAES